MKKALGLEHSGFSWGEGACSTGVNAPVLGHHVLAVAVRPKPLLGAMAGRNNVCDGLVRLLRACCPEGHRHPPQVVLLWRPPQRDEPCEQDADAGQHLQRAGLPPVPLACARLSHWAAWSVLGHCAILRGVKGTQASG